MSIILTQSPPTSRFVPPILSISVSYPSTWRASRVKPTPTGRYRLDRECLTDIVKEDMRGCYVGKAALQIGCILRLSPRPCLLPLLPLTQWRPELYVPKSSIIAAPMSTPDGLHCCHAAYLYYFADRTVACFHFDISAISLHESPPSSLQPRPTYKHTRDISQQTVNGLQLYVQVLGHDPSRYMVQILVTFLSVHMYLDCSHMIALVVREWLLSGRNFV